MKILSNLKDSIQIGNKGISDESPVFIVIETGVTSNGSVELGKRMIDVAKESGADAVKFQTIDCDEFMADKTIEFNYEVADGIRTENMYNMLKKHQFKANELIELSDYARKLGVIFYLSVDTIRSVAWAEEAKVAAYKIGSWDLRNFPLLEAVAKTGKPVQIDLGPVILGEVVQVLEFLEAHGTKEVMLVHCSHATSFEDMNLNTITYLKDLFGIPVGYSADSREIITDLMSIALGAKMIEKRLSFDIKTVGHHHIKSLEPDEFKVWVETIRKAESSLGIKGIIPSISDLKKKCSYFTSIVASRDIENGEVISRDMLEAKRPGTGISPLYIPQMIGKKSCRPFKKDEVITWDDWRSLS